MVRHQNGQSDPDRYQNYADPQHLYSGDLQSIVSIWKDPDLTQKKSLFFSKRKVTYPTWSRILKGKSPYPTWSGSATSWDRHRRWAHSWDYGGCGRPATSARERGGPGCGGGACSRKVRERLSGFWRYFFISPPQCGPIDIERSPLSLVLQTPSKSYRHYTLPRVVWGVMGKWKACQ